jgi:hypothetical protein
MARTPWYPKADRKELPQARTQPAITPRSVALHTAVSTGRSLYSFFNGRSNGVESHLYLRLDGTWEQYMPFNVRADCQRDGNRYAVSIESQDNGAADADDIIPWSSAQVKALVDFLVWFNREWGVPLRKVPTWDGWGIGFHAQFTSDRYPRWNANHACPGPKRIAQVPGIISRAAAAAAGGGGGSDEGEDDVAAKDVWEYEWAVNADAEWRERYGYSRLKYKAREYVTDASWRARRLEQVMQAHQQADNRQHEAIANLVRTLAAASGADADAIERELEAMAHEREANMSELRGLLGEQPPQS